MVTSPENKEKLRVPPEIAHIQIGNGELVVSYRRRDAKVLPVEEVEDFRPMLESDPLGDGEPFDDIEVVSDEAWCARAISAGRIGIR